MKTIVNPRIEDLVPIPGENHWFLYPKTGEKYYVLDDTPPPPANWDAEDEEELSAST
jgi:hypothetical protein